MVVADFDRDVVAAGGTEFQPSPILGENSRRRQQNPGRGIGFLRKVDSLGTKELIDNGAFDPGHDEGSPLRHLGNFPHIDLLGNSLTAFYFLKFGGEIPRERKGQTFLDGFFFADAGFAVAGLVETKFPTTAGVVLNRIDFFQNFQNPLFEELVERFFLDRRKIRKGQGLCGFP